MNYILKKYLSLEWLLAILLYLPGCGWISLNSTNLSNKIPGTLTILSGNNQITYLSQTLPLPITFQVQNPKGKPIANETIRLNASSGTLSANVLVTNTQGQAQVNWTLGPNVGTLSLNISTLLTQQTAVAQQRPVRTPVISAID